MCSWETSTGPRRTCWPHAKSPSRNATSGRRLGTVTKHLVVRRNNVMAFPPTPPHAIPVRGGAGPTLPHEPAGVEVSDLAAAGEQPMAHRHSRSTRHGDHHGYVLRGLCGLANAVPRAGSMAGHLGAATITGALMVAGLECEFEPSAYLMLYANLDQIMAGKEKWFNEQAAGVTVPELFIPVAENEPTQPVSSAIGVIANALRQNIGSLRQSGHNVIFASIAMRALVEYPSYCTPSLVSGIVKLISSFDGAVAGQGLYSTSPSAPSSEGLAPGRWFGHDAPLAPEPETPPNGASYESIDSLVEVTLEELSRSAAEHRQGFGGLHHLINHAAALVVLAETGYPELAATGMPAHWQHLRLYRALPNLEKELGPLRRLELDPRRAEYWESFGSGQWSAALTHSIKTLYGISVLLRHNAAQSAPHDAGSDNLRHRAWSAFGYLMA